MKIIKLLFVFLCLFYPARSEAFIAGGQRNGGYSWNHVAIGAGGQLTGIDIAPDGTKVVKTDVFGAYIRRAADSSWKQLVTTTSLPQSYQALFAGGAGVWEIRVASSNSSRLYMLWVGYLWRSDDSGDHWLATAMPRLSGYTSSGNLYANGNYKWANQKLAIDPANPDVVYVWTDNNGVQRSFDGGATFQQAPSITQGTVFAGAGMAFDASAGTTTLNGVTVSNRLVVPSYNQGVWQTTDGGQTFQQIADGSGGTSPTQIWTGQIGADGVYWCSDHSKVWKYQSGAWTELKRNGNSLGSVYGTAPDPSTPGRVLFVAQNGKSGFETLNNGTSLVANDQWFSGYPSPGQGQIATDIPWLQFSDTGFFTTADAMFDPSQTNRIYVAQGIGVWWANWPTTFTAFNYTSQSLGIEEIVANDILAPIGTSKYFAGWDRGVFSLTDLSVYQSTYGTVNGNFQAGWSLDYASSDPSFVVCMCSWNGNQKAGYTTSGGANWTLFPSQPFTQTGGAIAAASSQNMVLLAGNNEVPYYTLDGGANWSTTDLPSDGWIFAYYLRSTPLAADRVNIGTFYAYNYVHGLYRSTNGGANWTLIRATLFNNGGSNQRLRATPGAAGDLWYAAGWVSGTHPVSGAFLYRCTGATGTPTCATIPNVLEPLDFGFGKAPPGKTYPTLFVAGYYKGAPGIWRSDDADSATPTWTYIGSLAPISWIDSIKTINGDMNIYGRVYVGFGGSGYVYGDVQ